MLAVCGVLDRTIGGPPDDLANVDFCRRTLYGTIVRRELNDMLRLYDFPDPTTHSPSRDLTTTPLQQLFVLNSPFVERQAERLVEITSDQPLDAARIEEMDRRLFQRSATAEQIAAAQKFLSAARSDGQSDIECWRQYAQALLGSNEFMFID